MWLSDFDIVLRDQVLHRGSVRIEGDRIVEIVPEPVACGVEGHGMTLFPGFIDMHGDMIENELEPRLRVHFPPEVALGHLDARLAASGVTTAYAAVSFTKGARDGERRSFDHTSQTIRALRSIQGSARVEHRIHVRFDITYDDAVPVLEALLDDRMADLVSVMDHTPGQGQYRNIERYIQHVAAYHAVSETEAREIIAARIADRARPAEVILGNIQRVGDLCHAHGVPLASHDDDTVEKAQLMADLGAVISEFPVTQVAARESTRRGVMTAMGAPNAMRGQSYSGNLSAREAHARGLLNIIAADYHPAAMLPAVLILAKSDPGGLAGATRMVSANPAQALGLDDRGSIAPGLRADLVAVDRGNRVVATIRGGNLIYSNGTLQGVSPVTRAVA